MASFLLVGGWCGEFVPMRTAPGSPGYKVLGVVFDDIQKSRVRTHLDGRSRGDASGGRGGPLVNSPPNTGGPAFLGPRRWRDRPNCGQAQAETANFNDPTKLDLVAHRILTLASEAMPRG
jgi:hypothetical protein